MNNKQFAQWEAHLKHRISELEKEINQLKERMKTIEQFTHGTWYTDKYEVLETDD